MSASEPPNASNRRKKLYDLPDERLVAELRQWNGTAEQVLGDPELLRILLPVMRADLELLSK